MSAVRPWGRWCFAFVSILVAACAAPPTLSPAMTPTIVPTTEPSATGGSGQPASPAGAVIAHLPLAGLLGLAPAPAGVWYVRSEATDGWIGRATITRSVQESKAGPAPVAVVASADALYLLEGQPTFASKRARTNVIERLDQVTLNVVASSPVSGLGTDLIIADDRVWVVTAQGDLHAYREPDLAPAGDVQLGGRGDARVAASEGYVWVLNGLVSESETTLLLHRVSVDNESVFTARIDGRIGLALSAGESGVWVGTGSDTPGQGMLYPFARESFGPPLTVPTPIALADSAGLLWWASNDGRVGVSDGQVATPLNGMSAGTGAADVAISNGLVWVAEDTLVVIRPTR
jgi:hypothetical protein